jgi:ketosteroid isomerase-like protein
MSRANMEIVRQWSDSWSRRDVVGLSACFNDEIEVDFSNAQGPFRGIYRGPEDVIRFCRSSWDAWDEVTIAPEELIECGDECLVTATALRAKGLASGINIEAHVAHVWTFRQGKISRCKLFQTMDEALDAVGLPEQDAQRSTPKPK